MGKGKRTTHKGVLHISPAKTKDAVLEFIRRGLIDAAATGREFGDIVRYFNSRLLTGTPYIVSGGKFFLISFKQYVSAAGKGVGTEGSEVYFETLKEMVGQFHWAYNIRPVYTDLHRKDFSVTKNQS
jgi:hypothetical protein